MRVSNANRANEVESNCQCEIEPELRQIKTTERENETHQ